MNPNEGGEEGEEGGGGGSGMVAADLDDVVEGIDDSCMDDEPGSSNEIPRVNGYPQFVLDSLIENVQGKSDQTWNFGS